MTREEAIDFGEMWLELNEDSKDSNTYEFFKIATQVLKQEPCEDCINRQVAIDSLWKALYEYEDRTEKQFQESDELDIGDWIVHRIFVQNMSDIDRQMILNVPSVTPKQKTGHWVKINPYPMQMHDYRCSECYHETDDNTENYCSECGSRMEDGT